MSAPTLDNIRRHGIGGLGQFSVSAEVTHPDEPTETITFVGNVTGGPVVMVTPAGHQVFVTDPGRHGAFGPDWVRSFFADRG